MDSNMQSNDIEASHDSPAELITVIDQRVSDIQSKLKLLAAERNGLEKELRHLLSQKKNLIDKQIRPHLDSDSFPPEKKIEIFRSLFRGREDVFPKRFESKKTGKSGYQPVCANEWKRGFCGKPKIKCSECPYREWVPVSDSVIEKHLRGTDERGHDYTIGVYPLLEDETCFFLAVDFDKKNYREDVQAFFANMSNKRGSSSSGKIEVRQWRTCLDILCITNPGAHCPPNGEFSLDRDHGKPAGTWI